MAQRGICVLSKICRQYQMCVTLVYKIRTTCWMKGSSKCLKRSFLSSMVYCLQVTRIVITSSRTDSIWRRSWMFSGCKFQLKYTKMHFMHALIYYKIAIKLKRCSCWILVSWSLWWSFWEICTRLSMKFCSHMIRTCRIFWPCSLTTNFNGILFIQTPKCAKTRTWQ